MMARKRRIQSSTIVLQVVIVALGIGALPLLLWEPHIEGVNARTVRYLGLAPNVLFSLHPDYVMTHRMTPIAPDRTVVECEWLFDAGVVDPAYAVDFWDLTNRQDWQACASVQRGVASPHYRPGPLAPNEDAVYGWITMIATAYRQSIE